MAAKILDWIRFRTNTSPTERDPAEKGLREIEALRRQNRNAEVSQRFDELCGLYPGNWELLNKAALFEANVMLDFPKAIAYNKMALATNPDEGSMAATYRNLGSIYEQGGHYDMSLQYFFQALAIRQKILGEVHPDIALSYNHLGGIFHAMGDRSKAHVYYKKALDINVQVFGENHPSVASNYNNGGILYYEEGDYANALRCYTKSLEIKRFVFGEKHASVATAYFNIGVVHQAMGHLDEALGFFQSALDIRLSLFGKEAFIVGACYDKIGIVQQMQGRNAEALVTFHTAYGIFARNMGENHPETLALSKMINDLQVIANEGFTPPLKKV